MTAHSPEWSDDLSNDVCHPNYRAQHCRAGADPVGHNHIMKYLFLSVSRRQGTPPVADMANLSYARDHPSFAAQYNTSHNLVHELESRTNPSPRSPGDP
jgi:hypothetical protein